MSPFWEIVLIVGAIIALLICAALAALAILRGRLRRQVQLQQQQCEMFPAWARDQGYEYAETFPEAEAERLRGLAPLRPFSDFVFSRAHHVFFDTTGGEVRFILQLTVYSDMHAEAVPRGALTVAVAEVPAAKRPSGEDVHQAGTSRGEPSIHAHGRWVTSYLGGALTFETMERVTARLDRHLEAA